jgi:shikimate kinase
VETTATEHRNLILIGFMGTGKTAVGKRVARSLGYRFVDTDALIVKKAGRPITAIFAEEGEEAFRKLEHEVLVECAAKSGQVISTGGGIITQAANRVLLPQAGYVVWLKASPETIYERVRRNRKRPLLRNDDPEGTIRRLLEERSPLYEEVRHLSVRTDDLTLEETCFGVTESARMALGE